MTELFLLRLICEIIVPVLGNGFLSLKSIFSPDSLRINELTLPWLDVAIQIGNQLILLVTHARTEMSDAYVCLFGPPGNAQKLFLVTQILTLDVNAGVPDWNKYSIVQNIPQVRLWDEHVTHRKHAQTSQLFRGVENHRRETARHFGVQSNLDTGLDLVFTFDQKVQQLLSVNHSFTEIRHQTNQSRVPFVHNLRMRKMNKGYMWKNKATHYYYYICQ